jgi:threonine/homoserine/homoserine lactone efflux protein
MLGVSALLQIGIVRSVVGIAGALLLVFFGIRYLVASSSLVPLEHHNPSLFRSFAFGAGLTLTNPLTILFWTGVMGAMLSSHMFSQRSRAVWFALGCIVSTLLLLNVVALAGQLLQRVLSARLALWLNRAVGLALLGFAAKLAVDVLTHG